jgi:hypothetical protein
VQRLALRQVDDQTESVDEVTEFAQHRAAELERVAGLVLLVGLLQQANRKRASCLTVSVNNCRL